MNAKSVKGFDCLYRSSSGNLFYNVQLKSKKSSGSYRRKMTNLDTDDLEKAVKEIRKRQLFKKFNVEKKKVNFARMRLLESNLKQYKSIKSARDSLRENLELFSWSGFRQIKLIATNEVVGLKLDLNEKVIYFNPRWVNTNDDLTAIRGLRNFIS